MGTDKYRYATFKINNSRGKDYRVGGFICDKNHVHLDKLSAFALIFLA
jgi:hypothetical protein